jgi:hypothetical protein
VAEVPVQIEPVSALLFPVYPCYRAQNRRPLLRFRTNLGLSCRFRSVCVALGEWSLSIQNSRRWVIIRGVFSAFQGGWHREQGRRPKGSYSFIRTETRTRLRIASPTASPGFTPAATGGVHRHQRDREQSRHTQVFPTLSNRTGMFSRLGRTG